MKSKYYLIIMLFFSGNLFCQYSPGYDKLGSDAIYKDSSVFQAWAVDCKVTRGYINIADTTITYTQNNITSNYAFFGSDSLAKGIPAGDCVSLGDGGSAILSFQYPIINGAGPDFAVFENGFKASVSPYLYFLELAFVEVSTNGINYVRFPSVSLTQNSIQIETYEQLNPEKLYNLAGKHTLFYGTPFDLDELKNSTDINVDSIMYIRIIDVTGCINDEFASYDSQGNKINDPWSTPFNTCGFDLDAVGVIHQKKTNVEEIIAKNSKIEIFPNPANGFVNVMGNNIQTINIFNINGEIIFYNTQINNSLKIDISNYPKGIYIIKVSENNRITTRKLIVY